MHRHHSYLATQTAQEMRDELTADYIKKNKALKEVIRLRKGFLAHYDVDSIRQKLQNQKNMQEFLGAFGIQFELDEGDVFVLDQAEQLKINERMLQIETRNFKDQAIHLDAAVAAISDNQLSKGIQEIRRADYYIQDSDRYRLKAKIDTLQELSREWNYTPFMESAQKTLNKAEGVTFDPKYFGSGAMFYQGRMSSSYYLDLYIDSLPVDLAEQVRLLIRSPYNAQRTRTFFFLKSYELQRQQATDRNHGCFTAKDVPIGFGNLTTEVCY